MTPAMRSALIALMTASNMDARLYTWSIDPVMPGLLGAEICVSSKEIRFCSQ
jgi:hypothetical protein